MTGFPRLGLLRELRQSMPHRSRTPLTSSSTFPSSHAGLSRAQRRLPFAVFILAFRKSRSAPCFSYALLRNQIGRLTYTPMFERDRIYVGRRLQIIHLLNRVGGGDISTHRHGLKGSCSSAFLCSA